MAITAELYNIKTLKTIQRNSEEQDQFKVWENKRKGGNSTVRSKSKAFGRLKKIDQFGLLSKCTGSSLTCESDIFVPMIIKCFR